MEEKRFAVLIDADNVSAKYIKYIMDEIATFGVATYKRIYGDWTKPNTAAWKEVLLENSVTPVQQYSYTVGKNATDSAMIIDAMDILYSGYVDGYCIVSSDSDFTKLASRLRESGMLVVGMGEKKTPKPFIAACNQFKYLDVLAESEKDSTIIESNDTMKSMTDINVIKTAEIGNRLAKRYPDFDVRNYGDTKLSKFLKKFDFLDINMDRDGGTAMWVTMKPDVDHSKEIVVKSAVQKKKRRVYKKNTKRISDREES